MIFLVLSLFWFARTTKVFLFYLYLWQLKEYHLGRFLDHFRTEKGKRLLFNKILGIKIVLLAIFFAFPIFLPFLLIILYLIEAIKRKIKIPVLTKKTEVLISAAIIIEILFILFLFDSVYPQQVSTLILPSFYLLLFDIFTPFLASAIVLFFEPFSILWRKKLISKAKRKREKFKDLLVVGITGSYGKTSTKEFLATILAEKYNVLKTKEHQNSEVGISQCILNDLKEEHQIFICEMAAYNRGGIKLLSDIAKPKIGILTGINEQHMATFGSQENIIKTKYELIENLPKDGIAIFNDNNKYCHELYQKTKIPKKLCNINTTLFPNMLQSDIWAENIHIEKEKIFFKVHSKDNDSADFQLNLIGAQNVENILLAALCAKDLGMSLKEIAKACQKIKPLPHQMELIKKNGLNIIDATYSANPDGVILHLEYLKVWPGKKIIVMPCLIELGKASSQIHKKIGQKIGEVCDLAIITTKERFKEIKETAGKKALFIENPKEIFEKIEVFGKTDDIVLLESRVPSQLINLLVK